MESDFKFEQREIDFLLGSCAFRYCLGRMTYAVSICVTAMIRNWDNFSQQTKDNIYQEIIQAQSKDNLGSSCDIEQWEKIIKLYENE